MKITSVTKKDWLKLVELDKKLCTYEQSFDPLIVTGKAEAKAVIDLLKDKKVKFLVARENGNIIGHIIAWEEMKSLYNNLKVGFIQDIFIDPKFRSQGIGKLLIKKITEWFKKKGIKYVQLNVYSKNRKSIKLYKRLGFREFDKIMRLKI